MSGFEDPAKKAMRNISREQRSPEYLHPIVAKAYEKARKLIDAEAIDPKSFIHPYGEDSVQADIALAQKQKAKYETAEPHKKYADVMEAVLYEQIELNDWFGPDARTIKTSLYDDYVNHVDFIVEFKEAARALSHLGIAIDVTFGTVAMQTKFDKIRSEIRSGKLTEVKYFESERSPHKGLYQKLPRVVIGAEREHIIELAAIWLDPKRKKEFIDHPIQNVLLQEIVSQLDHFRKFARAVGQENLIPIFEKELALVHRILLGKKKINSEEYANDRVFGAIQNQLGLF